MKKNKFCKSILVFLYFILFVNLVSSESSTERHMTGQDDVTDSRNTAIVQAAKKVGPAVVTIKTSWAVKRQKGISPYHNDPFDDFFRDFFGEMPQQKEFKQQGLGSGVIISEDGYILTNEHVIHDADNIKIKLADGTEYNGKLEASDKDSDIALVKINGKKDFPFAVLGTSDDLKVGEWAVAIGNPFGFVVDDPKPTVTVGVVSAVGRTIQAGRQLGNTRKYTNLIQTDAAINPGNSGGPLVNILGEVIGINTAIFSTSGGSEGIGFAIPINTAKRIKNDLMAHGRVIRPMIGIQLQSLDKKWAKYYGLKEENGVLVAGIINSSPAEKAGIKKGDIILKLDGIEIKDARDMVEKVQNKRVGDKVALDILRDERKLKIEIVLAEKGTNGKKEANNSLGIEVEDINTELVKQYHLLDDNGVVITGIEMDSPSFNIGLRKGDVIKEINRQKIKKVSDFNKVLEKPGKDDLISMIVNRRGLLLLVTIDLKDLK